MKCETEVISYSPGEGYCVGYSCHLFLCPVCQDILQRKYLVIEVPHFDFMYCVILIYKLKVSDSADLGK